MAEDDRRKSRLGRLGRVLRRGASRLRSRGAARPPEGWVRVCFGANGEIEVPWGTTVRAAASQAGVDLPHCGGGTCSCGTCRVVIQVGADQLSPQQGREAMVLGADRANGGDRLACQARLLGPATIHIPDWF